MELWSCPCLCGVMFTRAEWIERFGTEPPAERRRLIPIQLTPGGCYCYEGDGKCPLHPREHP